MPQLWLLSLLALLSFFFSALLKSIGPPIDTFFGDQPSVKVVIIKLLWLDSGPSLLILLCFLFLCGLLEWRWLGCFLPLGSKRAQGSVCPSEVFERLRWQPQVQAQISCRTASNALTWSTYCQVSLVSLDSETSLAKLFISSNTSPPPKRGFNLEQRKQSYCKAIHLSLLNAADYW